MAIKFVLHGDTTSAYMHSGSGKAGFHYTPLGSIPAVSEVDATAIGGRRLNFDTGQSDIKAIIWPGFNNGSLTGKFAILARAKFSFTGAPNNLSSIFSVGGPSATANIPTALAQLILHPDGTIRLYLDNARGGAVFSNSSFGSWTPTAGVWYDFVLMWDGTTGANKVRLFIDGSSFGTKTAGASAVDSNGNYVQSAIILGMGQNVSGIRGDCYIDEFVIWDDEIDPTSAGLNLSGATRAAYVTVSSTLDPTNSTDPGITNVRNATGYIISGVTKTGSLVVPVYTNVKHGVSVDATIGSYRGYDLWESITAAQLQNGISKLQDGTTITGTLQTGTDPSASDVRSGISWINGSGVTVTGSLLVPAEYSGTSSQINYAQIKENIRFILNRDNTTTANFDLSTSLATRVKKILTVNPGMIPIQASQYPFVSIFVDSKDVEARGMAVNQKNAKREAKIQLKIVGGVWNNTTVDKVRDKAEDECELLMENIEEVIRRDSTFQGQVLWHMPNSVTYHNQPLKGEEANLRIGIMNLECKILY